MGALILGISVCAMLFVIFWLFNTFERRVVKRITEDANVRGVKALTIREATKSDGVNPFVFNYFQWRFSEMLDFYKIVIIENRGKEEKYWIKINTFSMMINYTEWRKGFEGNPPVTNIKTGIAHLPIRM